ncbi:hypothetical protein SO802_008141, partial [Lithocarpus litseifolius]
YFGEEGKKGFWRGMKFKTPAYFGEEEESCSHTPEEEGRGRRRSLLLPAVAHRRFSILPQNEYVR